MPSTGDSATGQLGALQERRARFYLQRRGLRHLASNYRCRWGELDLIMLEKNPTLVVVEVRYRSTTSHGGAQASLSTKKLERIRKTTRHYIQSQNLHALPVRFDVVAIQNRKITWLKGAFE